MRKHPNFEEFPNNLHIEGMEINSLQLSHKALGILFAVRVWRGGSETVGLTDGVRAQGTFMHQGACCLSLLRF